MLLAARGGFAWLWSLVGSRIAEGVALMMRRIWLFVGVGCCLLMVGAVRSSAAQQVFSGNRGTVLPATAVNPWAQVRRLPAARAQLGAVTIGTTIYLAGGVGANFNPVATFWAYSPSANTYSTKARLPVAIGAPVLEGLRGLVYAFGTYAPTSGPQLFAAYRYTPASNTWQALPRLADTSTVAFQAYGVGSSGRIYAINGNYGVYGATPTATEVYTPSSNTWTTLETTPSPDARVKTNIARTWSSSTQTFASLPTATNSEPPGHDGSPIIGPDGRYYVIGGCRTADEGDQQCYPKPYADVLDSVSHRWGLTARMPGDYNNAADWVNGAGAIALTLAGGKIYLFGGYEVFYGTVGATEAGTFTPGDTTAAIVSMAPQPVPSFGTSITLNWKATDANGVSDYDLQRRTNGSAWKDVPYQYPYIISNGGWMLGDTSFTQIGFKSGDVYQYRVAASDSYGNTSGFVAGPSWSGPIIKQDTAAGYAGTWTTQSTSLASGGSLHTTKQAGATATFKFTGKAVAFLSPIASNLGEVKISIDGVYQQTVNEYTSYTATASDVLWAKSWASSGTHTLKMVCAGTAGHPRIDVDAFKVIS